MLKSIMFNKNIFVKILDIVIHITEQKIEQAIGSLSDDE
jgi:hypothetical protein